MKISGSYRLPVLFALLLLAPAVSARDKGTGRKGADAIPTPTPVARPTPAAEATPLSPEMEKLQFLVGEWVHQELDHQGQIGVALKRSARSKNAWIHNNRHLYLLYKSKAADSEYEARGFIAWDAAAGQYRLDWFDSRGAGLRYAGVFGPDGVLAFSAAAADGSRQSIKVKKQADGRILFLDERTPADGAAALWVESLAQTAPPPPLPEVTPCGVGPRPRPDARATPSARPTARPTPLTKATTTPRPTPTKTS